MKSIQSRSNALRSNSLLPYVSRSALKQHLHRRNVTILRFPHPLNAESKDAPSTASRPQDLQKSIDSSGAGGTLVNVQLQLAIVGAMKFLFGRLGIPIANARPEDIQSLLGGALFLPLYKWMLETGPVYLLPTGPASSFLVVSDPQAAKHVLRSTDNPQRNIYGKGLVTEVSQFLFGDGFAVAEGDAWRVRRKAVAPSLHRTYLETMLNRVFGPATLVMNDKLAGAAASGKPIDIESCYSQLTLDIIGKSVFNYDFNALTSDSPIIQAVYTALKETETRSTDLIRYWKYPLLCQLSPRQRKAAAAVQLIRDCTADLIKKCREMVAEEEMEKASLQEDYINDADPSVLRFLIAAREEVDSTQLRDDLLSMLVAGHETTGSVLTWTSYLLAQNPECMKKVQAEIDAVMGDREIPTVTDYANLKYTMRCVNESMRLYPHPPVLIRRALVEDELPGFPYKVQKGQDVLLSIYNIHRSPAVWERPDEFVPERFDINGPIPNEQNTDYKYIPFSGGARKCVGDQFALMEAVVALATTLKRFDLAMVPGFEPGLTTGATIHTKNGLFMTVQERVPMKAGAAKAALPV